MPARKRGVFIKTRGRASRRTGVFPRLKEPSGQTAVRGPSGRGGSLCPLSRSLVAGKAYEHEHIALPYVFLGVVSPTQRRFFPKSIRFTCTRYGLR